MSPLPNYLVNRWADRSEPASGEEVLYWHILLGDSPAVQDIAALGQSKLASFPGLHFTPRRWLHMTVLAAGPVENFGSTGIESMTGTAAGLLAGIEPVAISLGSVLYHPEAIALGARPDMALDPVHSAMQTATRIARDKDYSGDDQPWRPHVTLAYSTSFQDARPIIDTLGRNLPAGEIIVDRINLVIQQGPERQWRWRSIAEIALKGR